MAQEIVPKFVNDPTNVVNPAVEAYCQLHPDVRAIENTHVVVLDKIDPKKVALVCGGGSGHEPAHIGFVKNGWLSAAVCGDVFASPPTSHVTAAINYLHQKQGPGGAGILVIVKQYTGDMINFGFAVREAQARRIKVKMVVVADDAAFGVQHGARRGIAGTVVTYKLLGAAAAEGKSLPELIKMADRTAANLRSIGASLSSCSVPGQSLGSVMPPNTLEVGLGIHGEKGMFQIPQMTTENLVDKLLGMLLEGKEGPNTDAKQTWGSPAELVLLTNNLGGTTDIEMGIVSGCALSQLRAKGFKVVAASTGRYMTALEMHGISLTLLKVTNKDDARLLLSNPPRETPFFSVPTEKALTVAGPLSALLMAKKTFKAEERSPVRAVVTAVFAKLLDTEAMFNSLDAAVGDGDMGSGVHRAAAAVLEMAPFLPWSSNLMGCFSLIAKAVADSFGGTSGPMYGTLIVAAAEAGLAAMRLRKATICGEAMTAASEAVHNLGGASKGDRTMYDVLIALSQDPKLARADVHTYFKLVKDLARSAADATAQLPAKMGRSRYLNGKEIGLPDPGAELVAYWVEAATEAFFL